MKIVMAGQNYHIVGGSDRVFFDEIELLSDHGHEVVPFCAKSEKNLSSPWEQYFPQSASFESPGVGDVLSYIYSVRANSKMNELLDSFSPDLAHFHIYYGKLTGSIISPLVRRGIPIVQTLHEYKVVCPTYTLTADGIFCDACSGFRFYQAPIKRCNRGSFVRSLVSCAESYVSLWLGAVKYIDHFVAVSDFLNSQVVSMGVPKSKVTTIHNFVDVSPYEVNYDGGDYFLYFGRVENNKGVWPLIQAFERLPQVKLVVVGDGAELSGLRRFCESREGGLRNITFLGFKQKAELIPLIRGALCTIVPSIWNETFGLTVAESFACGKPVIASRIGGIPEVVADGEDAILVEPGNVEELVSAVELLDKNRTLAVEMGKAGRQNVERKFSKEQHYDRLHSLYRSVMS